MTRMLRIYVRILAYLKLMQEVEKFTKKKTEEAVVEALQELLKLSNNGCDDIILHKKALQEYLSKVITVILLLIKGVVNGG